MTFGQALRIARENRGWSRFKLLLKAREHMKEKVLSLNAIENAEMGTTKNPHGTTRAILTQVLPELIGMVEK